MDTCGKCEKYKEMCSKYWSENNAICFDFEEIKEEISGMTITLKPSLKIKSFNRFKDFHKNDIIDMTFILDEYPVRYKNCKYKEYTTKIVCYSCFNNISEDYKNLANLTLNEYLLNKYFYIEFPLLNERISFRKFDDKNYKKFILNNLNRAIMEYSL